MTRTIMLVEDVAHIMRVNRAMLAKAGYRTLGADTIASAREILASEAPDLMVLDIMLPDGDGVEFCRELRVPGSPLAGLPVLFLSAKGHSEDIIDGLRAGGDDYLSKPYDINVLVARVGALLRRSERAAEGLGPASSVQMGPLTLDISAMRAFVRGRDLSLTPREFAILLALARHRGEPVPAGRLYEWAWGMDANDDVRTVRTLVSRLRAKLRGQGDADFAIETCPGRGYVLLALIDDPRLGH
ncbi:MAG: response regulator transcription factor [Bifidobacteriaceae bacterium]|jgi:DNA-binding response OmpR family regulator|nr:response regulator transcription factor [Bifidobacteriaceae bacterium]